MHFQLTVKLLIMELIGSVVVGQMETPVQRSSRFKGRRCPVQLDETVFHCVRKDLIEVPDYMHQNTAVLDLDGNQITILHEGNFLKLNRLVKLVLDNNRIWKITENSFKLISGLLDLSLRNNDLSIKYSNSLTSTILAPLQSLQRLDLSHNPLDIIPRDLFGNSSKIKTLILDATGKPLTIADGAFFNLPNLELVSLENNQLTTLSRNIFHHQLILKTNNIRLGNNPFDCNCSLKWLRHEFERDSSVKIYHRIHNPSCYNPLRWRDFPLVQLPLNELDCATEIIVPQSNFSAVVGGQISLICHFYFSDLNNSLVTWTHNNKKMSASSRISFRTRRTLNFTSIVNISLALLSDSGVYECRIKTRRGQSAKTLHLNIVKLGTNFRMNGIRIVFIVGIILSVVIIFVVIILGAIYLVKYHYLLSKETPKRGFDQNGNTEPERHITDPSPTIYRASEATETIDGSLSFLPTPSNEYRKIFPNTSSLFLLKPTFQCSHATLSIPEDKMSNHSVYTQQCPIHGGNFVDNDSRHGRLNFNCPLHGPKNERLYYYQASDN